MDNKSKSYWTDKMDFSGMITVLTSMKEALNNVEEIYKIKRRELETTQKDMKNGDSTNHMGK